MGETLRMNPYAPLEELVDLSRYQAAQIPSLEVQKMEKKKPVDLKPCPFCGNRAELAHTELDGAAYVQCVTCGCRTISVKASCAVCVDDLVCEVWNRRV